MRIYRLPIVATAETAQVDLAEINPTSTQMVKLLQVRLGQTSRVGDAQENELGIQLITGFTTTGSGGNSSVTAVTDQGDAAFTGTCKTLNTTLAVTGTTTTWNLGTWNVRTEFLWIPVPLNETPGGIWIPNGLRAVIRTTAAPAASTTMNGEVIFGVVGSA